MSWDADRFSSITDELLNGFLPGFFDRPVEHQKDFYMDLVLDRAEAFQGGYVPIEMPVLVRCPACNGMGSLARSRCSNCLGYGRTQTVKRFSLYVPPGARSGVEEVLPLDEVGLMGSNLHITVIVSDR
jgi:DnaJ-class molecular chaperone